VENSAFVPFLSIELDVMSEDENVEGIKVAFWSLALY
jgi:hypothetical protein